MTLLAWAGKWGSLAASGYSGRSMPAKQPALPLQKAAQRERTESEGGCLQKFPPRTDLNIALATGGDQISLLRWGDFPVPQREGYMRLPQIPRYGG